MSTLHEDVRPIGRSDAAALAALEVDARAAIVDARGGSAWLAETPAVGDWTTLLDDPVHPAWAATIDGHVVGFLDVVIDGATATVRHVYVQVEARELGLGDALLAAAIEETRRRGCTRLEATALPGDRHTKNLYERAGIVARKLVVSTEL